MPFKANMITPDGKKMMYLLYIKVKEDSEYYDAMWKELHRKMAAVSIPIVPVDWSVYNDDGEEFPPQDGWYYAQKFEVGMGFIMGVLDEHELRINLERVDFYNGDGYRADPKRYDYENVLEIKRAFLKKYHPEEEW